MERWDRNAEASLSLRHRACLRLSLTQENKEHLLAPYSETSYNSLPSAGGKNYRESSTPWYMYAVTGENESGAEALGKKKSLALQAPFQV